MPFYQLVIILQQVQQTDPISNSLLNYGLAGALIIVILVLIKYFRDSGMRDNKSREDDLMEKNKFREERYATTISDLKTVIEKVDQNYRVAIDKMDKNHRENIEKFVGVIRDVMEQNNYSTQILTELKSKIEASLITNKDNFKSFKHDITNILQQMGIEYNLTRKDK